MTALGERSQLWPAVRRTYAAALILFTITIVIGILNGLNVYEPDHDTLMTHVHAGTLGWITLAVSATILLIFSSERALERREVARGSALSWAMIGAIALYVAAFFAGDRIPGDRIQRPIAGTILFVVVIWFLVWMWQQNRAFGTSSVARFGLLLAWVSLTVGAVLGVILGIYSSRGDVPGLSAETAARFADAHPPAMVIGFLLLAAISIAEWLIRPVSSLGEDRWGTAQMIIVFTAGMLVNIAFAIDNEQLLGPANGLEVVGAVILIVRLWKYLAPSGWERVGLAVYGRLSIIFLILDLVVLTYLVSKLISGAIDINADLSDEDLGLVFTLDHLTFIGVATNVLFGSIGRSLRGLEVAPVDRVVMWGVNIGLLGFATGLITTTEIVKQIFAPIMGTSLLIAIVLYVMELSRGGDRAEAAVP